LSAIEWYPDVFSGAVALSGGSRGLVAQMLSKLDMLWTLKTLVDPDAPLTLVNLPPPTRIVPAQPYAEDVALTALINRAKATPQGRARLALAAAFDQAPRWSVRNTPQPAPRDVQAQLTQVVDGFTGAFSQMVRANVEAMAGGNPSWNHGVNYETLLDRSGLSDLVRHAYDEAGLDLRADLQQLGSAPRIVASPAAVAAAEKMSSYSGRLAGPVIAGTTAGDPAEPPSIEAAYEETVRRAGRLDLLRVVYSNRPAHASWSVVERVTVFQALVNRLESGRWDDSTDPDRLNALAAGLRDASSLDLGSALFVALRPAAALRTWDFSNWGSYRTPGR
jgi:hypothetical protein